AGTPTPTSARAASPASAAKRQPQHGRDGERHQPPRVDTARHECRGRSDRERDPDGRAPVVADDEVPPEEPERAQRLHAKAGRRRRFSVATAAAESRTTKASTPGSDASSPGQCTPVPSADQKMPKVVSITPTVNLSVFSGTRVSGPRTSTPAIATSTSATPAPSAA